MRKFEKELELFVSQLFEEITGVKLAKKDADRFVNTFENHMKNCIANDEEIQWTKFFVMKPAIQAARTARNPQTGEIIQVPEKKTVKVKVSSAWKRDLNS